MRIILDTYDLAALLHVSRRTVSRWVCRGKISGHRIPGTKKVYFDRYEVEEQLGLPHLEDADLDENGAFRASERPPP